MEKTTMAMQLEGTSTTLKRRNKEKRLVCVDCGESIKLRSELVVQNGENYHLFCAGFSHVEKVAPCPDCFTMAPCLCVGS